MNYTGLVAAELANAVVIIASTGIQLRSLINGCLQICLGRFLSQIGTRDIYLQGRGVRVGRNNIKIFRIHEYFTGYNALSFVKRTAPGPRYCVIADFWSVTNNGGALSSFSLQCASLVCTYFSFSQPPLKVLPVRDLFAILRCASTGVYRPVVSGLPSRPVNTISIIIPVLNEAAALAAHLPFLQTWRDAGHEVIVVDGGSSDQSLNVCQPDHARYGVDRLLSAPPGRASQMNAGARVARGDLLLFLHIDSILPAFIPPVLSKIGADQRLPRWGRFDVRLTGSKPVFRLIEFMMNLRSRLTGIATGDQAIFVQCALFLQMGGFPAMPLMEDVQICTQLKRLAGRPLCLREQVISDSRRWEQRGVWRTIALMWRLRLAFFLGGDPQQLHQQYYHRPAPRHVTCVQQQDSTNLSAGIAFFARTPEPGRVKTRFIPTLGEEGASALHCELIRLTWQRTHTGLRWPMTLWMSEPGKEDWFARHCPGAVLALQQGQDLGLRMSHALQATLKQHALAIVIGADCASLDSAYLDEAVRALQQGADVVLGPAEDGGYVLLGVRRTVPESIFEDIAWGTDQVLQQTRAKLRALSVANGLVWEELAPRWDVDRPGDLPRLATLNESLRAEAESQSG